MGAIRNPETQKNGFVVVVVVYGLGNQSVEASVPTPWNSTTIARGLPIRIEAIHFCHDSMVHHVLFAIVKTALSPFINPYACSRNTR
jgi:hypothetical protein